MKSLLYISILLITAYNLSAQQVIKGTVTDAGNGQPVDAATVQIRKTGRQLPLTYTLTKADGTFILPLHQANDSLFVHVSLLGYKAIRQKITAGTRLLIRLEPEIFTLKEVEIRPGRVYGQHDTINYDVSQFISPKDEAIKDVLKKLPGVDVDDDGKISYNGKNISKFYVEGMDLTDGRYNQLTNNLQAGAVKSVQILENHQPIRALQKKLTTEDIAINLKLKDNFRDRWMGTLEGSMGIPPLLWEGMGNAIQISRKSQSAYIYKGNNRGNNVTDEQNVLTQTGAKRRIGPSIPSFLSQPSFSAPLKKERLLFNNVHSFSGNRIYKLNEATQLRFNINYLHDLIQQERGSITHYYQAGDTVTLKEQNDTHIRTDRAEVALTENVADQPAEITVAYTLDGGDITDYEYETFNAAKTVVTINGFSIHPGTSKDKMRNALLIAMEYNALLPALETPAHTEGYEGFFHLQEMHGKAEKATMEYIVRDHDMKRFQERKAMMDKAAEQINRRWGDGTAVVDTHDQYYNMYEVLKDHMEILELAESAMKAAGIEHPTHSPIRGGTDGSVLTYKGLLCPNLPSAGHNAHGRYEYAPVESLKTGVKTVKALVSPELVETIIGKKEG